MKLLRIDSSARAGSVSRQLTSRFVDLWKAEHPDGHIVERDLSTTLLPQITDAWDGTYVDEAALTAEQRRYLTFSDILIDEVRAADTIVVGAPMYNFTISWPLKAWIDQIVRLNRTVTYSANGPRGMLSDKKVVILTARGGSYRGGSAAGPSDFQEPYLRRVFAFIGLTDVTFVHAELQYRRGEQAAAGRSAALAQIDELFTTKQEV